MWDIIEIFEEAHKIPDRLVFELANADSPLSDGFFYKVLSRWHLGLRLILLPFLTL
jgi:hypothetical protein